jgi:hypothetical protein
LSYSSAILATVECSGRQFLRKSEEKRDALEKGKKRQGKKRARKGKKRGQRKLFEGQEKEARKGKKRGQRKLFGG